MEFRKIQHLKAWKCDILWGRLRSGRLPLSLLMLKLNEFAVGLFGWLTHGDLGGWGPQGVSEVPTARSPLLVLNVLIRRFVRQTVSISDSPWLHWPPSPVLSPYRSTRAKPPHSASTRTTFRAGGNMVVTICWLVFEEFEATSICIPFFHRLFFHIFYIMKILSGSACSLLYHDSDLTEK